jgi:hypothetical protein
LVYGVEFGFTDKRSGDNMGILANNERKYWKVDENMQLVRLGK